MGLYMQRILKTLPVLTVALSFMILFASMGVAQSRPNQAGPQAMVLDAVGDFGILPQHSEVSHVFWLRNRGQAPLTVEKIKPGCSCTSVSDVDKPIQPGDSVAIEVSFRSGRYRGKVHKKTRVFTDDPDREEVLLHIIADVVDDDEPAGPVKIKPFEVVLKARDDTVGTQSDTLAFSTGEDGEYRIEFIDGPEVVEVTPGDQQLLTKDSPMKIVFEVLEPTPAASLKTSYFSFRVLKSDTTRITIPVTIDD